MTDTDLSHSFHLLAVEMRRDSEHWFPELHGGLARDRLAIHYALGLAGEVGELINIVKKGNRISPNRPQAGISKEKAADEIADVFIYLTDLAHELGINVWDAFAKKHGELEERWGKRPAHNKMSELLADVEAHT